MLEFAITNESNASSAKWDLRGIQSKGKEGAFVVTAGKWRDGKNKQHVGEWEGEEKTVIARRGENA